MRHHHLTRRTLATATATLAALALTACSPAEAPSASPAADASLASLGLEGLDAREIVDTLDATPLAERSSDFVASIRPDELIITDADQNETSIAMPEDAFYVSIAPYVEQTHECWFHSLTTCTGELQNADIDVTVVDTETGEELVAETMTTFDNGFVGLWLPRDVDAEVTIAYDGLTATSELSTSHDDDATCVTTMQLG